MSRNAAASSNGVIKWSLCVGQHTTPPNLALKLGYDPLGPLEIPPNFLETLPNLYSGVFHLLNHCASVIRDIQIDELSTVLRCWSYGHVDCCDRPLSWYRVPT